MEKNITIRPERVSDYQQVEDIIRQAFYNLYTPGCTEHYLAHAIRPHPDFLPELDLVRWTAVWSAISCTRRAHWWTRRGRRRAS